MSLESTLAQIQVRSKEIAERSCTGHNQGIDVNWSRVNNYTDGIVHEAAIVYDSYRAGKGAKTPSEANRHLGEFATGLKNMADNVNGLLQTFYNPSVKSVSHKEIVQIDGKTPALDNGTSMLNLFLQTHDHVNGDVVKMRNRRSHGSGHDLVHICNDGLKVISGQIVFSVEEWMEDRAKSYFGMTSKVLDTLAEKEEAKLSERKEYSGPSVFRQMFRNWRLRHQKPVAIGAAGAMLASGILGTIFVQNISRKDREIYEGRTVNEMVLAAQYSQSADSMGAGQDVSKFNQVVSEIDLRSKNLGVDVDNYVMGLKALSNGNLSESVTREYDSFNAGRQSFRREMNDLKKELKTWGMNPKEQIDTIARISMLMMQERWLFDQQIRLQEKLNWRKQTYSSIIPSDSHELTKKE